MTKYTSVPKRETPVKIRQVHPIWRAIGCIFIILIPLVSYAAGRATVDYGLHEGWPIPPQLLTAPSFPDLIYKSDLLARILYPVRTWNYFYAYAAATIIYITVLGGVLSFVNAFVYQVAGPPRWGPLDAPPPKIKSKQYKR